jgi:peroxiredoxin Q/BCP
MKSILLLIVLAFVFTTTGFSQELNVGDKAPKFKTLADDGSTWDVSNYVGDKFIVVYFYPAAMTGGCTKQACAYRDLKNEIASVDALVVGVSGDNVEGLRLFKKAYDLNFPLLSDESGEIAKKFGVPMRDGGTLTREVEGQSYDLTRGNTASRWTFVIDKSGKIAYKNTSVDATKDTEQILEFIKSNS